MASFATLDELCQASLTCTACVLSKTRTRVVPGDGDPRAKVLFIGEGPGYHEDQQGKPFVGPAGKLLDELIASIRMKRSEVYITNVVKCRPPGNREPLPTEIDACRQWLDPQIELIKPLLIATLGRYSLAKFITKDTITKIHGTPRKVGGYTVLPLHHPAAALYQQSLKKTLEEDFKKIPALLKQLEAEAAPKPAAPPPPDKPRQLGLF